MPRDPWDGASVGAGAEVFWESELHCGPGESGLSPSKSAGALVSLSNERGELGVPEHSFLSEVLELGLQ